MSELEIHALKPKHATLAPIACEAHAPGWPIVVWNPHEVSSRLAAQKVQTIRRSYPKSPLVAWLSGCSVSDLVSLSFRLRALGFRAIASDDHKRGSVVSQLCDAMTFPFDLENWAFEVLSLDRSHALLLRELAEVARECFTLTCVARQLDVSQTALRNRMHRASLAPASDWIKRLHRVQFAYQLQRTTTPSRAVAGSLSISSRGFHKALRVSFDRTPRQIRSVIGFESLLHPYFSK